jgi:FkbM family methyltransferase
MNYIINFFLDLINEQFYHKKILINLKYKKIKKVLDVGAHKGEFLKSIQNLKSVDKIYCVEPQKEIFDKYLKKYKKNKKIKCFNFAISNKLGKRIININKKTSTTTFSKINPHSKWSKIKNILLTGSIKSSFVRKEITKVITIDKFCQTNKINKIDLLKIDTEGHEKEVLMGGIKMLSKKKIRYILLEFHLSSMYKNYKKNIIENILRKNNFKLLASFKFPFLAFEDRIYYYEF